MSAATVQRSITRRQRTRLNELVRECKMLDEQCARRHREACRILGVDPDEHSTERKWAASDAIYDAVVGRTMELDHLLDWLRVRVA